MTNSDVDTNHILSLQRLSDKNRNPKNILFTDMDKSVFEYFKTTAKDTVVIKNDSIIYYKPIKIMMPTCLKCHGEYENIDTPTIKNILLKYPNDKAMNYKEGDLRGLWKIKLK